MAMQLEDIPRRQERLILADATQRFERLLIKRIFDTNNIAAFAELAYIARVLWSATLRGQALTKPLLQVESRCGAVALGCTYLFPPLSSGGALVV
jgi:hypothetical protein